MATRSTGNPRNPAPQSAHAQPYTTNRWTPEENARQHAEQSNRHKNRFENYEGYEETEEDDLGRHSDEDAEEEDQQGEKFDDKFVSGYDEDYEEDEDLDADTMHNRRETVKSMGGRSRVNKVTDRKEHSGSGEKNREQGYRQRAGAATSKARKGATEKK
ncbi:hypothetical protein [uncultured Chitinophaga sp.]|uniref:hypothetical protein n=1 Tax=uncultured Chitinophaga sp. TaxID=339340 RepID=UPI0025DE33E4|nr:hypothetical protein [uncultured Chitinophaga sp.]